ncbi:hypothetical protein [Sulfurisoma sediminicola]|uniref:Uncharacterized protein n=1 Tax=Sulfurisoma sediminicola TaxID=1381557 RepID=A0A497XEK4_9PROT|nr:hypothetical protein [Sulfurisoma sediminicola]RLJ64607.1 hypothetical protein DFR35_1248 [Sulfurisoma sediminicola]
MSKRKNKIMRKIEDLDLLAAGLAMRRQDGTGVTTADLKRLRMAIERVRLAVDGGPAGTKHDALNVAACAA